MEMQKAEETKRVSNFKMELRIFYTALMFLTRIPVPKNIDHSELYLQKAPRYFPIVGWVVAAVACLSYLVLNRLFSTDLAILGSMIATILCTGAFHEDGFADCCDGFGGGWTREKILLIMKDSRLGTFGTIGLISILATKFLALKSLPQFTPSFENPSLNIFYNYRYYLLVIWAGHSLSRLMPLYMMQTSDYVTDIDLSKVKPMATRKLKWSELIFAIVTAFIPFIFLSWHFLLAVIPVLYCAHEMRSYFKKWIGGYTGDCLGAIQQVTEIVFYLGILLVWKFLI
jgi:adenosylcobinamide-GDP ribazoletransferase